MNALRSLCQAVRNRIPVTILLLIVISLALTGPASVLAR